MKVVVNKTVSVSDISYGKRVQSDVVYLDNVISITETADSGVKKYAISHKTGSDADYHVTMYTVADHIISIMPA